MEDWSTGGRRTGRVLPAPRKSPTLTGSTWLTLNLLAIKHSRLEELPRKEEIVEVVIVAEVEVPGAAVPPNHTFYTGFGGGNFSKFSCGPS